MKNCGKNCCENVNQVIQIASNIELVKVVMGKCYNCAKEKDIDSIENDTYSTILEKYTELYAA